MKTKKNLFMLMTVAVIGISGCSNDDNYIPEEAVVNAFKSKYPDAKRVEWESQSGFKVADFIYESKETEAWFDTKGEWLMTETDIRFNELPSPIQNVFAAGDYANWHVEDVDMLSRPNAETVYVIEVEQGETEINLYYSADGTLIKEVTEENGKRHEPVIISDNLQDKIKQMYPNATILEYDREGAFTEIDIRDGGMHKEVLFDSKSEWVSTSWDIRTGDVPAVIMNAVKGSTYANYRIDDVEIYEKPTGIFYVFELESGDNEVNLTVKENGTIVK